MTGSPTSSFAFYSSISEDGRYVAFSSNANGSIGDDTHNIDAIHETYDVLVYDRHTDTSQWVSVTSNSLQGDHSSFSSSLSGDSNYMALQSIVNHLISADSNQTWETVVHSHQC